MTSASACVPPETATPIAPMGPHIVEPAAAGRIAHVVTAMAAFAVARVSTAAGIFGLSTSTAEPLIKAGACPVPTVRVGHRNRVPVAPILAARHLDPGPPGTPYPAGPPGGVPR